MPATLIIAFEAVAAAYASNVFVQFAVNFALSYVVTRVFGTNKPGKQTDMGMRQQVPPAANNPIPIVYGDAWLGGTFVDAVLSTDNKTMYYVLVISNISADGQFFYRRTDPTTGANQFYYGDRLITFDGADPTKVVALTDGAGNIDTKVSGNLYINLYTSDLAGNITPVTGSAPSVVMGGADITPSLRWPATGRQMNGLAFAIVKLTYNSEAGTTGLQPVTFKVSHYLKNTGAAKPGDVLSDYLTSTVYGCSVPLANVNTTACAALNTYSDEVITFAPYTGGTATQPRYRINGVLNTGENALANIDKILAASDSWLAYQETTGQWMPVINKADATALAFNDSNIIGELRVSVSDLSQSINKVEATFPWKGNKDQPGIVFLETPSALLYPNEPVNKATISLDLVNDSIQAQYLANRMLEQAREDLIVTFSTAYTGIQADAGDVISITNSEYGWTDKLFRVMRVSEVSLPDGNLGAQIECSEYNAAVYDNQDITQFAPAPNSNLASAFYFSALAAPTVGDQAPSAAVPSFSVTCNLPTTGRVTTITLFYTTSATPSVTDWKVWGTEEASNSQAYTPGLAFKFPNITLPAATYYFAFKVANEVATSQLSAISTALVWAPTGAQSAFLASFSPSSMSVPRANGTPSFTGLIARLYGVSGGTAVDFITAQTDSDPSFVNNSWRIGGSASTGYGDISTTGGLVLGSITDGGTYAQWGIPTAMTSSPATLTVPVRFKNSDGTVSQAAAATLQWIFVDQGTTGPTGATGTTGTTGPTGTSGNQYADAYLYQWSPTTPGNPSGQSTYDWTTGTNTAYTGGNGWSTTLPSNPGTPGLYFWIAVKPVTAVGGTTSTTVSWASGFTVVSQAANGATGPTGTAGSKTARPTVYQWAITIPAGPTGTSTYTWSTGTWTPNPAGWSSTITSAPSPGYTLWAAEASIIDVNTATTTTINWTTASILSVGYSGTNGPTGPTGTGVTGPTGSTGAQARLMYARIANNPVPVAGTVTVSGDNKPTGAQGAAVWGAAFNVTWYDSDPNPSSNDSLYQADGIYNGVSTTWSAPYISALKVGTLSAITVNTGALTVQDTLTLNTLGKIRGGQTDYNTGNGFFLGYSSTAYKFSIGDSSSSLLWDGSSLSVTGNSNLTIGGTATFQGNWTPSGASGFNPNTAVFVEQANSNQTGITVRMSRTASNGCGISIYTPPGGGPSSGGPALAIQGNGDSRGITVNVATDKAVEAITAFGAAVYGYSTSGAGTAWGGYFVTTNSTSRGIYTTGIQMSQANEFRWQNSAGSGIGAYMATDANDALYIISGASGSADPKAVLIGTKATARVRVEAAFLRPEVDNAVTLGAASFRYVDVYAVSGSVNTSDEREKNILGDNPLGLNFINRLQTIQYKWKVAKAATFDNVVDENNKVIGQVEVEPAREGVRTFHGLSAQQVKATLDSMGIDSFAGWTLADKDDPNSTQGLRYSEFIAPLIKAVQELSQKVADLEARLK